MTSIVLAGGTAPVVAARTGLGLPALVEAAGDRASWRFIDFFTATISNHNTRAAYYRAVTQFLTSCQAAGFEDLKSIRTFDIAEYFEAFRRQVSEASVKQHLAAVRRFFDWMATGGILEGNPAAPVRGPKMIVRKGKTPVLDAVQTRVLLDSLPTGTVVGLRDRALIAAMVYTFGRISAVVGMNVEDFFLDGRQLTFRLHEKGGKYHTVPAHHKAVEYVGDYLDAADLVGSPKEPLFQTAGARRALTGNRLPRESAHR